MTLPSFVLLLAVVHAVQPQQIYRPNQSIWSNNREVSEYGNYDKVPLVEPKFKSKQLAGVGWYGESNLESGIGQKRHLEWLESSASDSESAETTEKSLLEEWLEDEDTTPDNVAAKEDKTNTALRQHRKKYVKVDKMLLPLLLAYKLKFFTMVPVLIGALVLLVGTTGLAGFFFALFAAAAGLHVKG